MEMRLLLLVLSSSLVTGQETVRFITLGDWGYPALPGPPIVADLMAEWAEAYDPHFILTLGDNFYPNGVQSVDDPYWDYMWRYVYNHTSLADLVWYVTVGNHDYGRDLGEVWVQVDFGKIEPRWYFPHLWYSRHVPIGNEDIHFIAIDTEVVRQENINATIMMEWLENELQSSTSKWKIVFGHRPVFTAGEIGPIQGSSLEHFNDILIKYDVDVFLTGHDHNLQHLQAINQTVNKMDYIISGGGGAGHAYYSPEAVELLNNLYGIRVNYYTYRYGFVAFLVSEEGMHMQFWNIDTGLIYEYTRVK